jgi:hypothetical protein
MSRTVNGFYDIVDVLAWFYHLLKAILLRRQVRFTVFSLHQKQRSAMQTRIEHFSTETAYLSYHLLGKMSGPCSTRAENRPVIAN